jgi:dTDP-4-dehydrorhamnose reductase
MIGHKLWQTFSRSSDEVFGTLHGTRQPYESDGLFDERVIERFEAEDAVGVVEVLDRLKPAVIVNCIGITKRKPEATDVKRMFEVNALFPHHLARWAARHNARVIHFSTDCVFNGADGNYAERSVMTAPDLYGQSKYFGEIDYDHCLTIRTSMIGRELSSHTELLEWFLAQRGRTISGFKQALYSGVTTPTMATILQRLIKDHPGLSGKYQIAGPVISKFDLLCQLRDAFDVDVQIVPEENFHCDRTLQAQRFTKATGISIPSWRGMIAELSGDRKFYDNRPTLD